MLTRKTILSVCFGLAGLGVLPAALPLAPMTSSTALAQSCGTLPEAFSKNWWLCRCSKGKNPEGGTCTSHPSGECDGSLKLPKSIGAGCKVACSYDDGWDEKCKKGGGGSRSKGSRSGSRRS